MLKLLINIPSAGISQEIQEGQEISIGRSGGQADIQINDPSSSISRAHLKLGIHSGIAYVIDTASANGVVLNGTRIQVDTKVQLLPISEIDFGACRMALELREIAETPPPSKPYPEVPRSKEAYTDSAQSQKFLSMIAASQRIRIGRSKDNDIVLDPNDRTVGRWHAELVVENGSWYIVDLKSKNGIYLNDKRIKEKQKVGVDDNIYICLHNFSLNKGYKDLREEVAIDAKGIEKKFPNGYVGLKSLNIQVPYSKFIAVMGPSGCGKSTLLKVLNGDNPATSGQVTIHGLDLVKHYNLLKKKIGYVPQDDIIHKELTVEQTMFYSAKLRLPKETPKDQLQQKIMTVLISLFDEEKTKAIYYKRVDSLSGGERKRLSIAVELLTDPSILFLDEPTSPLDPESIHEFLTKLNNLKKNGTTIIMVTHKPEDLNYVDDVVFLGSGGQHVYYGKREQILNHFNKKSIIEVYGLLSDKGVAEQFYQKLYQSGENSQKFKKQSHAFKGAKKDSFLHQLIWLTRRYFQIKLNDRGNILLLVAQPLIIGALISIIFSEFQLGVIFLMAISAIWFGVSNAAKEIVSEQSIYKRERMFNLWIDAYILSKINVLAVISFIQLLIFETIIYFRFKSFPPEGYENVYQLSFEGSLFFMFFLAISATLLGLMLSAIFSNTEKVMTVVPIALMPQIMLAGVITKIDNWGMELLSFLTLGRWGTEGLSRIQDDAALNKGDSLHDNMESVIAYVPEINLDTIVDAQSKMTTISQTIDPNETKSTTKSAMGLLDYYNEQLVDDGRLIGSALDSLAANVSTVMVLNLIIYISIYVFLKKKDSI